jgi:hypothetical protein
MTDDGVERALWAVALMGVSSTVVAGVLGGGSVALSVAVGALAGLGNLWVLARVVRGFIGGTSKVPWPVVVLVKLVVLYGGLYILVQSGFVAPLPLIFGWGALPLGIVAAQLGARRPVSEKG